MRRRGRAMHSARQPALLQTRQPCNARAGFKDNSNGEGAARSTARTTDLRGCTHNFKLLAMDRGACRHRGNKRLPMWRCERALHSTGQPPVLQTEQLHDKRAGCQDSEQHILPQLPDAGGREVVQRLRRKHRKKLMKMSACRRSFSLVKYDRVFFARAGAGSESVRSGYFTHHGLLMAGTSCAWVRGHKHTGLANKLKRRRSQTCKVKVKPEKREKWA